MNMLADSKAFRGFAVDDTDRAREFYGEALGLEVEVWDEENGLLNLKTKGNEGTLIYRKPDHRPATYTILNWQVDDIDATVQQLTDRGVTFERYDGLDQDDKGIMHGPPGPNIAWFKDPAG